MHVLNLIHQRGLNLRVTALDFKRTPEVSGTWILSADSSGLVGCEFEHTWTG